MAIELTLTKTGCLIVAEETEGGEFLIEPIKNISFKTFGETISLRIGTDSQSRRYELTPDEVEISGVVPANAAAFIVAMGVLLECTGGGGAVTGAAAIFWEEGIAGTTAGMPGGDPSKIDISTPSVAGYFRNVPFLIVDGLTEQAVSLGPDAPAISFDDGSGQIARTNPDGSSNELIAGQKIGYFVMLIPV